MWVDDITRSKNISKVQIGNSNNAPRIETGRVVDQKKSMTRLIVFKLVQTPEA